MASIYDSNYITQYDDTGAITQISSISTQVIASYAQSNNATTDLIIGSSSNVIVQSKQGIQMYITDSNTVSFFLTDTFGSNIRPILSISNSNDTTILSGSNLMFNLTGSNNLGTFANSNIMLFQGNSGSNNTSPSNSGGSNVTNYLTNNVGGFGFQNNVNVGSNLVVQGNITAYENIACAGNLFGSTFNIFTNTPNCNVTPNIKRVSYSFFINHYNQLDLLRTDQLLSNNQVSSRVQRIMTFGNTEFKNQLKDNPDYYQVVSQFSGVNGNYSNGATSWITDVKWMPACCNNQICYMKGNVGIGTVNPLSAFHVVGNTTLQGSVIPTESLLYDIGTNTNRFRDLYLSGSNIYLKQSKISVDATGNLNYINPSGQSINLTSNISANTTAITSATSASNIAYSLSNKVYLTSNLAYPMSNVAYTANNMVSSLSNMVYLFSNALNNAVSASFNDTSNMVYALSNVVSNAVNAASFSNTSNMAYTLSNVAGDTSNMAYALSNAVSASFSNTSNMAYALSNVVGDTSNMAYPLSASFSNTSNIVYPLSTSFSNTSNMAYALNNLVTEIRTKIALKAANDVIEIGDTFSTILTLSSANQGKFYQLYIGPTISGEPYFIKADVFWNSFDNSAYINTVASNNGLTLINNGSNIQVKVSSTGTTGKIYGPRHPIIDITTNMGLLYNVSASTNTENAYKSFNKTLENGWWGTDNVYDSISGLVAEGTNADWLQIQVIPPIELKSYWIKPEDVGAPSAWDFSGSIDSGESWTVIDTVTNYTWMSLNEAEFNITTNGTAYSIYRLTINKILSGTSAHIKYFALTEKSILKYPMSLYKI